MTESGKQICGELSPLRLLIADDSLAIRAALRQMVERCGDEWSVCAEALDGQDAVRKAVHFHPDAILLDLSIPAVSGLDAAKILQRDCPASEVILMSAQEQCVLDRIAASVKVRYSISKASLATRFIPLMQEILLRKRNGCEAVVRDPTSVYPGFRFIRSA